MKKYELLNVETGINKNGKGWSRLYLKGRKESGTPICGTIFVPYEIGRSLISSGIIEGVNITVEGGLDDYLRPCITNVRVIDKPKDNHDEMIDIWETEDGK